jgi:hypothetical protein
MTTYIAAGIVIVAPFANLDLDLDQTDALNDWIRDVPDGPGPVNDIHGNPIPDLRAVTVIQAPTAPIRCDGTLNLTGRQHLAIRNLTIQSVAWPRLTPHLLLDHCNHIHLHQPTIIGTKPADLGYNAKRETETAYRLAGSQNVTLNAPSSQAVWGDHLYFGKTNRNPAWTQNVTVIDGTFGDSGRDPIAATAARNITIARCTFGNGRTCIDLEPNGAQGGVDQFTVTDCIFDGTYTGIFLASASPSDVGTVENVTVTGNTVTSQDLQTMIVGGSRRANFTLTDNTGTRSVGRGSGAIMNFDGVTGTITVTGNTNPVNPNRNMRMARFPNCAEAGATINYHDNQPADLT